MCLSLRRNVRKSVAQLKRTEKVLRGIIYTRQKNRPVLHYPHIIREILQGDLPIEHFALEDHLGPERALVYIVGLLARVERFGKGENAKRERGG